MNKEQEQLRQLVKVAKWQQGKSYKEIAAEIDISYNAFMNWLHNDNKNLGYTKRQKLKSCLGRWLRS